MLARPFAELFPAFAGAVFGGGPQTLSLLMSAQGVGALLGAAWVWRGGGRGTLPGLVQGFGLGLTVALLAFTATRNLYVALPAMVLAGLCHVVCNIAMQSLAQLQSAPAMRGRVLALYGLLFRTAPAVGAFLIAQATRWINLQWLVGAAALAYGCFMLGRMWLRHRSIFAVLAVAEALPVQIQHTRNSS
jgi:predicted MFS family arabinose efflux permease